MQVYWKLNKKTCYEIQLLKTQKKSIKIKWQSQHDQKILFYVYLQSKLSQLQKNIKH
jgi:hypothetical protein